MRGEWVSTVRNGAQWRVGWVSTVITRQVGARQVGVHGYLGGCPRLSWVGVHGYRGSGA